MPICIECNKEVLHDYQSIKTKRGSDICICDSCIKKTQRKEVANADNSKQPV